MKVRSINAATVSTLTIACLKAAATFGERVVELRAALPAHTIADRNQLVTALRPGVASYYGIECAEHGQTGKFVTEDEKLAMAARTALSKLARAVEGPVVAHTEDKRIRVTPEERAAYEKMAKSIAVFKATCGDAARVAAVTKACKAKA